jgi:type IV pilus assembly protein PilB
MASDQLWGSLVKAMTTKIEVPKLGQTDTSPGMPTVPPTPQRIEPAARNANAPASREGAIQQLANALSYVPRAQIEGYLDDHGGEGGTLMKRLQAIGAVTEITGGALAWWRAMSNGALSTELLAEALRTAPGMPRQTDAGLLFDFLLDAEAGGYKEVKTAQARSLSEGRPLLEVLVEAGALTEARAADLSSEFYGLRRRRGKKWTVDVNARATVTAEVVEAFGVVPISDGENDALTLLVQEDPGELLVEPLKKMTGREIRLLVDTASKYTETHDAWQEALASVRKTSRGSGRARSTSRGKKQGRRGTFRLDQDSFAGITYVPDMVQAILERATEVGATDIHLEPQADGLRVRFRIDSILHDVARLQQTMGEDVISRIKVMSDMDITERRKPQDGHSHQELGGSPFDFRIATVPTSRGERMSIRITAAAKEIPELAELGLNPDEEGMLFDFTKRSHGIVLACGPVGSGKTTTLYASLNQIDALEKNIMTIEDPVEIEMPNVSQVSVNYKIGMDFSAGLRALLRQDPNIILVGEIRDFETAKVAIRGSLTGLLVYSSIHANSAPGAVTTLYNFNIAPFLLATSLVGVVAQRLVRTICTECAHEFEPDAAVLEQAKLPPGGTLVDEYGVVWTPEDGEEAPAGVHPIKYMRGAGCDHCYGTGYAGRTAIFEILDVTEEMRHAISERAPEESLRQLALDNGMNTLADSGRRLVVEGRTTIEEFGRVLYQ